MFKKSIWQRVDPVIIISEKFFDKEQDHERKMGKAEEKSIKKKKEKKK